MRGRSHAYVNKHLLACMCLLHKLTCAISCNTHALDCVHLHANIGTYIHVRIHVGTHSHARKITCNVVSEHTRTYKHTHTHTYTHGLTGKHACMVG